MLPVLAIVARDLCPVAVLLTGFSVPHRYPSRTCFEAVLCALVPLPNLDAVWSRV